MNGSHRVECKAARRLRLADDWLRNTLWEVRVAAWRAVGVLPWVRRYRQMQKDIGLLAGVIEKLSRVIDEDGLAELGRMNGKQ